MSNSNYDIIIIGAGCSGYLTAIQILNRGTVSTIALIDAANDLGPAYRTTCAAHVLNVQAKAMSIDTKRSDDFVHWLDAEHLPYSDASYVPRKHYARYLRTRLEEATRTSNTTLHRLYSNAINLQVKADGVTVELIDGRTVQGRQVVLATGNGTPALPIRSQLAIANPWLPLTSLVQGPICIIGSGLTAVDCVLALEELGYEGRYTMISRKGLLPQAHLNESLPPSSWRPTSKTLGSLVREFRQEAQHQAAWQIVFDAVRGDISPLWQQLAFSEQRRFLRHLRSYWEAHRHRVAPEVAATLNKVRAMNRLSILRGRVIEFVETAEESVEVHYHARGQRNYILAGTVINATGPSFPGGNTLHQNLLRSGIVTLDPHGLGFACDDNLQLANRIFGVGPILRGTLWETTAVREIREQAERISTAICGD